MSNVFTPHSVQALFTLLYTLLTAEKDWTLIKISYNYFSEMHTFSPFAQVYFLPPGRQHYETQAEWLLPVTVQSVSHATYTRRHFLFKRGADKTMWTALKHRLGTCISERDAVSENNLVEEHDKTP